MASAQDPAAAVLVASTEESKPTEVIGDSEPHTIQASNPMDQDKTKASGPNDMGVVEAGQDDAKGEYRLPHITVFGSLNMDIFSFVSRAPRPGETIMGNSSATLPGGKGANQAAACAKLSRLAPDDENRWSNGPLVTVQMLGAVGDDDFGVTMRTTLEGYGVDCSGVRILPETATGMAIIVVESNGENRIIVNANANKENLPSHFPTIPSPKPDLLVMQLEIPIETAVHMARLAKSENVPVMLNPSPVGRLPEDVYMGLDHLVMNETECRSLLGHANPTRPFDQEELRKSAMCFIKKGVKNVIITLGSRGVFAHDDRGNYGFKPAHSLGPVVDTTGAGDTFTGAYALGVVLNKGSDFNIMYAIDDGAHAAAVAVTKKGAMPSIPYLSDLYGAHVRFDHSSRKEEDEAMEAEPESDSKSDWEPGKALMDFQTVGRTKASGSIAELRTVQEAYQEAYQQETRNAAGQQPPGAPAAEAAGPPEETAQSSPGQKRNGEDSDVGSPAAKRQCADRDVAGAKAESGEETKGEGSSSDA